MSSIGKSQLCEMKSNFQVAQSSPDLTKWHPKAPGMTPPDTFADRKEAVSFGNSYDRKLKYDEKIAAIEDLKGDEKDDTVAYCVCIKNVNNGDNKLVMLDDEQAKESLNNVMVQQSVMEDNFKMKEEIRKYKELCMKQVLNYIIKPTLCNKVYTAGYGYGEHFESLFSAEI